MTTLRYVNDLGNGHSGYINYGSINVSTASGTFINTKQGGDAGSDAFGRLRISSPLTIFDSQQRYAQDSVMSSSRLNGLRSFKISIDLT